MRAGALLALAAAAMLLLAAGPASAQTASPAQCFRADEKFKFCYAVLPSSKQWTADQRAQLCAAKGADGKPLAYKTQHACCAGAFGIRGCAFSGGATSLSCWAPDAAAKKCTLRRIGEGSCDTGLKGGYQDQAVCQSEEFPGGKPRLAGVSYVQRMDVAFDESGDIPSTGGQPFTRVCGGKGMFEFTCARTLGCVGYSVDAKELTKGCAYLKKAGGKSVTRRGWLTFVKQGAERRRV